MNYKSTRIPPTDPHPLIPNCPTNTIHNNSTTHYFSIPQYPKPTPSHHNNQAPRLSRESSYWLRRELNSRTLKYEDRGTERGIRWKRKNYTGGWRALMSSR